MKKLVFVSIAAMLLSLLACNAPGAATQVVTDAAPTPTEEPPATTQAPTEEPTTEEPTTEPPPAETEAPTEEVAACPEGWETFTDPNAIFALCYPPGGPAVTPTREGAIAIGLPIAEGTNLSEKFMEIYAFEGAECTSPHTEGYAPGTITPEPVIIGELTWITESGADAAAGNFYEWTAYSIENVDGLCVSLAFVLHSANIGNYETPPAEFDKAQESAVFEEIVSTFRWLP